MRAIIIENETDAQELLSAIIANYIPELELIGIEATVKKGVELINNEYPDLIFLDIDLDDGTGFDLLEKCKDLQFHVIFTTAFDEYAIKAFQYETIDYLLKPYGVTEVQKAIKKLKTMTQSDMNNQDILNVMNALRKPKVRKIPIYTQEGITMYDTDMVVHIEGEGSYSNLYTNKGKKTIVSKTLGELEKELPSNFFRVHKSHIVNVDHVAKFVKEDGGYLIMTTGVNVAVSRRKKDDFIKFLTSQ